MTQSTSTPPHIELTLSVIPSRHSFSDPSPPTLSMTLLPHSSSPITLFTWNTPLHLQGCLTNNGITITDLTSSTPVPTTVLRIQRTPITRARGSSDEELYLTLEPNVPLVLKRPFGRGGVNAKPVVKPLPKSIVQQGWELNDKGEAMKIRRSTKATGVDGLEAGHVYRVGVNMEKLKGVKWTHGTKEDVLVDGRGKGAQVQDFEWEEGEVDWGIKEAEMEVVD